MGSKKKWIRIINNYLYKSQVHYKPFFLHFLFSRNILLKYFFILILNFENNKIFWHVAVYRATFVGLGKNTITSTSFDTWYDNDFVDVGVCSSSQLWSSNFDFFFLKVLNDFVLHPMSNTVSLCLNEMMSFHLNWKDV